MNFRTVGTIRRGLRRGESGQAFAELTVSLVAILAAFVGFLLIAALGSDRVSMLVRAREEADRNARSGLSSNDGRDIGYWTYGEDGIPFTADDDVVEGAGGDGELFRGQLADNSGNVRLDNPPASLPRLRNDFSTLQDSGFFVNAASLATGDAGTSDTLRDHEIGSLEGAVRWLFGVRDLRVEERVYMPAHKSLSEERGD